MGSTWCSHNGQEQHAGAHQLPWQVAPGVFNCSARIKAALATEGDTWTWLDTTLGTLAMDAVATWRVSPELFGGLRNFSPQVTLGGEHCIFLDYYHSERSYQGLRPHDWTLWVFHQDSAATKFMKSGPDGSTAAMSYINSGSVWCTQSPTIDWLDFTRVGFLSTGRLGISRMGVTKNIYKRAGQMSTWTSTTLAIKVVADVSLGSTDNTQILKKNTIQNFFFGTKGIEEHTI